MKINRRLFHEMLLQNDACEIVACLYLGAVDEGENGEVLAILAEALLALERWEAAKLKTWICPLDGSEMHSVERIDKEGKWVVIGTCEALAHQCVITKHGISVQRPY